MIETSRVQFTTALDHIAVETPRPGVQLVVQFSDGLFWPGLALAFLYLWGTPAWMPDIGVIPSALALWGFSMIWFYGLWRFLQYQRLRLEPGRLVVVHWLPLPWRRRAFSWGDIASIRIAPAQAGRLYSYVIVELVDGRTVSIGDLLRQEEAMKLAALLQDFHRRRDSILGEPADLPESLRMLMANASASRERLRAAPARVSD